MVNDHGIDVDHSDNRVYKDVSLGMQYEMHQRDLRLQNRGKRFGTRDLDLNLRLSQN